VAVVCNRSAGKNMTSSQILKVPGHKVVQYLGSGAGSTIWQIRNGQTGEDLALKRVVKRQPSDVRFLNQAINEYEVASRLDHPAMRRIHRMRRVKKWLQLSEIHLFMELCEGTTLQESRPEDVREVVRIFSQVGQALVHVNSRGFVHSDMKPNNIVVRPDGSVKIIDLGQSCSIGTIKERIQGTPDFIAPEQVHRRPLDSRTDVFNFGAALYWTLTGQPIPTALPRGSIGSLKVENVLQPPEQLNENVPASLSKLVTDCVQPNPSHRPGSMSEVLSRLNLIAHTLGVSVEADGGGI
jgi:serine/threonine-protein kinase